MLLQIIRGVSVGTSHGKSRTVSLTSSSAFEKILSMSLYKYRLVLLCGNMSNFTLCVCIYLDVLFFFRKTLRLCLGHTNFLLLHFLLARFFVSFEAVICSMIPMGANFGLVLKFLSSQMYV